MLIRRCLGLRVRIERIGGVHAVIRPGAVIRDDDVALYPGGLGGIHRADCRVPVDGVGAVRVAAPGARGEDHRVGAGEGLGESGDVGALDIEDCRIRPDLLDVVRVVGITNE